MTIGFVIIAKWYFTMRRVHVADEEKKRDEEEKKCFECVTYYNYCEINDEKKSK